MSRRIRPLVLASALAVALALTGCTSSSDDLAKQYNAGDSKGYIAGDGSVTEIAEADRGESVTFEGTVEDDGLTAVLRGDLGDAAVTGDVALAAAFGVLVGQRVRGGAAGQRQGCGDEGGDGEQAWAAGHTAPTSVACVSRGPAGLA